MGATVTEASKLIYTDVSACFGEGMRLEDVKKSIFEESPEETFAILDIDRDGILSHDEISQALKNDIEENKHGMRINGGIGLLNLAISYAARKASPFWSKVGLMTAIFATCAGLSDYSRVYKAEKRLANGHN